MKKLFVLLFTVLSFAGFAQTAKTDAALTTQAQTIKNETIPAGNTPQRIGTMHLDEIASKVNGNQYAGVNATGTNTYSANTNPAITSLPSFYFLRVVFNNANTGASSLNFCSTGAKSIKKLSSGSLVSLSSGDLSGSPVAYLLMYNGSSWQIMGGGASGGGGGGGTVLDFSAEDLSPLFTTSVATSTTTPDLSFTLSNAAAHKFLGNATGSTGAPSYSTIGSADIGATTLGYNMLTLTNPSAVTFPRFNADNTITARTASQFAGDIKAIVQGSNTLTQNTNIDGHFELNAGISTPLANLAIYADAATLAVPSSFNNRQLGITSFNAILTHDVYVALVGGAVKIVPAAGSGVAGNTLRATGTDGTVQYGAINLASSAGVTGTLPVANGGTGTTTPALVAGTNITITGTWPNQTINSSGGGGGGITNGAANNELMKSNGTDAVASGLFSTSSGLVTTGIWNATVIAGLYGGTGVANSGKTITLGGNLTTSGAFNTIFTVTGSNTITFPNAAITVARIDAGQTFTGTQTMTAALSATSTAVTAATGTNTTVPATTAFVQQEIAANTATLPLSLTNGGTAASLTASNGGIFYSTGTVGAILSGTATANKPLVSGSSTTPAWAGYTIPSTLTTGDILYASSSSVLNKLSVATDGYVLTLASGIPSWAAAGGGGGSSRLDQITAATTTATINNAANAIEWQWNTLAGAIGLSFTSTSTAAASNAQKLFSAALSGTNGTSAQTTYAGYFSNAHAGTTSTNYAVFADASNGTTANYTYGAANAGTVSWQLDNLGKSNHIGNTNGSYPAVSIINSNSGSSANVFMQFGNNTGAATAYIVLTSSTNSSFAGSNSLCLVSNGAIGLSTNGTTAPRLKIDVAGTTTYTMASQSTTNTMATWTQPIHTGGSPVGLLFTQGAHTTLATTAEATAVNYNLSSTVQWAAGTVALQRFFRVQAPTVGFASASTMTDAVTLDIGGAPIAGTNATLTRAWGARIGDNVAIGGKLYIGAVTTLPRGRLTTGASTTNIPNISFNNGGSLQTTSQAGDVEYVNSLYYTSEAGTGGTFQRVGIEGKTYDYTADVGTPASSTETDLFTTTLPYQYFTQDGDALRGEYALTAVSTGGATKRVRVYFAGTSIYDSGTASIIASTDINVTVLLTRTGSSTARAVVKVVTSTAAIGYSTTITKLTSQTWTGTNIIKVTGASGAGAASNDIVGILGALEYLPAGK